MKDSRPGSGHSRRARNSYGAHEQMIYTKKEAYFFVSSGFLRYRPPVVAWRSLVSLAGAELRCV